MKKRKPQPPPLPKVAPHSLYNTPFARSYLYSKAVESERKRCLDIVAKAKPDYSNGGDEPVQFWTGGDWIKAVKRTILREIASGEGVKSG